MKLTEHFDLDEFVPAGVDVTQEAKANLYVLCLLMLEPARVELGRAITVSSGWRPGDKKDHGKGRAADLQLWGDGKLLEVETNALFHILRENGGYGQIIYEDHRKALGLSTKLWVHAATPSPKHPGIGPDVNRTLVSFAPGNDGYEIWDETRA